MGETSLNLNVKSEILQAKPVVNEVELMFKEVKPLEILNRGTFSLQRLTEDEDLQKKLRMAPRKGVRLFNEKGDLISENIEKVSRLSK